MKGTLSLSEIIGKKAAAKSATQKLTMDDLGSLLGDTTPEVPYDAVGRYRLTSALRQRFGDGWRNISAAKDILSDFEERLLFEDKIKRLKGIKP